MLCDQTGHVLAVAVPGSDPLFDGVDGVDDELTGIFGMHVLGGQLLVSADTPSMRDSGSELWTITGTTGDAASMSHVADVNLDGFGNVDLSNAIESDGRLDFTARPENTCTALMSFDGSHTHDFGITATPLTAVRGGV